LPPSLGVGEGILTRFAPAAKKKREKKRFILVFLGFKKPLNPLKFGRKGGQAQRVSTGCRGERISLLFQTQQGRGKRKIRSINQKKTRFPYLPQDREYKGEGSDPLEHTASNRGGEKGFTTCSEQIILLRLEKREGRKGDSWFKTMRRDVLSTIST